ncbi:MAG: bacillithiol system redox-active protein YtxJ [Planctomycetes bacterium]|nr:bacillithiol system redox-active protein YtxJ [Planctomycetota bacterium]
MHRAATTEADLEQLIAGSDPAWVFKHSNTCPISSAAFDEFQSYLDTRPDDQAVVVVVQTQRPLSNWIATRLKHTHQSPQVFLVRSGTVLWSASHWSITAAALITARQAAGK